MSKEREKYYGTFEELYLENYRLLFVMAGDYSRDDHGKKRHLCFSMGKSC